jgi:hypothetical protein
VHAYGEVEKYFKPHNGEARDGHMNVVFHQSVKAIVKGWGGCGRSYLQGYLHTRGLTLNDKNDTRPEELEACRPKVRFECFRCAAAIAAAGAA